jgi:NADH:ubiquinone oxidoreductase subunit 4 (subunit M)
LASILLKLGGYGFIRFLLNLIPSACLYFSPVIFVLALCGIIFASFSTLRQIDVKRIIAYSSIAHMNMAVLGLFVYNTYGLFGALYLMLGHGLIATSLFFAIGVLYDRYHTRLLFYYGGLTAVMPLYSFYLLFFSFANIGFPGTFNFISELNILIGVFLYSAILLFFMFLGFLFTVIYSIWLFNRVMFGALKTQYITSFSDIN